MKQTEKRFAFAGKRIAALPEAAISQQGMDVYGSLAFLLHHGGSCDVLHLNTKQKVSSFHLASYTGDRAGPYTNHANQAVFCSRLTPYQPSGALPLMYVSIGNGPGADEDGYYGRCAVEQICIKNEALSSELLQTISYCDNNEPKAEDGRYLYYPSYEPPCWGLPAFFPNTSKRLLYLFSARYRTTLQEYDCKNAYLVTVFSLPDVYSANAVIYGPSNILDQMAFPYDFSVTQGGTLYGKYLIQAFGFGTAENPNGILIFDLDARKTVCRIDLSHSVFATKELEDCAIWRNALVCNTRDGCVYELCSNFDMLIR